MPTRKQRGKAANRARATRNYSTAPRTTGGRPPAARRRRGKRIGRKILLAMLLLGAGYFLLRHVDLRPVQTLLDSDLPDSVAFTRAFSKDSLARAEKTPEPEPQELDSREEKLVSSAAADHSASDSTTGSSTLEWIGDQFSQSTAGFRSWVSKQFVVEEVSVNGAFRLPRDTLLLCTGELVGEPIFELDLGELAERVEQHPLVHRASLLRRLPNQLLVIVQERREVALLERNGRLLGVDDEGILLPEPPPGWPRDLPLISGDVGGGEPGDSLGEGVRTALRWIEASGHNPVVQGWISELHLEGPELRWILGVDGWRVQIGSHGITPQLAALDSYLQRRKSSPARAALVDLRFPGYLIVRNEAMKTGSGR